jgi:hypothetical protein
VNKVGNDLDKSDGRVAAAVTVARENADKPTVVKAETGVALSYLPKPSDGDVAFARQRAASSDSAAYKDAEDAGRKLLAKINDDWANMEAQQKEAARVSALKDAKIKELTQEVVRVKQEASNNIWSLTGAGLVVVGGLACAFASIRIGIPLLLCGAFAAAVPFIIDSPYFEYIAGTTLVAVCGLGLWWLFDKVRDSVKNDVPPSPSE